MSLDRWTYSGWRFSIVVINGLNKHSIIISLKSLSKVEVLTKQYNENCIVIILLESVNGGGHELSTLVDDVKEEVV